MPIDGPLMAIDGPHGTAMAIDELRWDLSTGLLFLFDREELMICCVSRRPKDPTSISPNRPKYCEKAEVAMFACWQKNTYSDR